MLVLAQRADSVILILLPDGRRIEVRTVETGRRKIRLGFIAPPDVKILRAEVANRIAATAR